MYDLVIVGAGAAGLSAAIYAARAGLNFIVLDQNGYGGGQIMSSHRVDNYPGLPSISGEELGEALRSHAEKLGAEIAFGPVEKIEDCGEYKEILIAEEEPMQARAVIVATGASPRTLDVPGEEAFTGRGVSYCAICDGSFYAGKDVLVIGGGDTAVGDALYLSSICKHVTIALRRKEFRAAKSMVDQLLSRDNITVHYEAQLLEVLGDDHVHGAVLWSDDPEVDGEMQIPVDGIFIAVGIQPESSMIRHLPIPMEDDYVVCDETCRTEIPGLYAAGDIRKKPLRQVVTAVADGANAASDIVEWLMHRS